MKKENLGKRVDLVTIKMVREKSLFYSKRRFSSPNDVQEFCRLFLENEDREKLIVISLDIKNQPTSVNVASVGTLNSSLAHPREIFKTAILSNAASIIIAHNHPSGDVTPSKEDVNITLRLKEAGNILGIELVDHLIISDNGRFISLKEKNIL